MAQGRLPGQAVKRPARACRPTHTSDGTSLFCRALIFAAHTMSQHIWSTSRPFPTWAAERGRRCDPGPTPVRCWAARSLRSLRRGRPASSRCSRFWAESGHISAVVMSFVSRLGELPYDTLTLKNSARDWRRSARSNEPLPARFSSRTGRPTDLYDSATEDG